jgi:heme/copper-type cytochrome/quinol oxidase subunit 3
VILIFGLILTVICGLSFVFLQLYRFKKEFQKLDEDQVITVELAKKLTKSLYGLIIITILGTILSSVAIILP